MHGARRLVLLAGLLAGCEKVGPRAVQLSLPGAITSMVPVQMSVKVVDRYGRPMAQAQPRLTTEPEGIASVGPGGSVRCLRNGDFVVVASYEKLGATAPSRCSVVASVRAPDRIRLSIPGEPATPAVSVLGPGDEPLAGVPVVFASADPSVVAVEGLRLRPVVPGSANVIASAGDRKAVIRVEVMRKIFGEVIHIGPGMRANYSLPAGDFEVEVRTRPAGVALSWVGGDGCENRPVAPETVARCLFPAAGTLLVENPAAARKGSADGSVSIFQVP